MKAVIWHAQSSMVETDLESNYPDSWVNILPSTLISSFKRVNHETEHFLIHSMTFTQLTQMTKIYSS